VAHELIHIGTKLSIPDVAVEIVITSKEEFATLGEAARRNTAQNLIVGILVDLVVGTDVEQTARRVVGTGDESVAIGEELHGVDVGLVASEGLDAGSLVVVGTHIPELTGGVARTGDKGVVVHRNAHHITSVVVEDGLGSLGLDVPQDTSGITRRGQNLIILDETAARQVTLVLSKLGMSLLLAIDVVLGQLVHGAQVVEATAGHESAGRRVGASHDPGGTKRDGVHLVGGERVPDDELTVLRSRHQVTGVRSGPVHGIDLAKVTLEDTTLSQSNVGLDNVFLSSSVSQMVGFVSSVLLDFGLQIGNLFLALFKRHLGMMLFLCPTQNHKRREARRRRGTR